MSNSAVVFSGSLFKLGGGAIQRLQERQFALTEDGLLQFSSGDGDARGVIEVRGSTIIDRGTYMGKLCFSIEGHNQMKNVSKEYFLFTESKDQKWGWINNLMSASGRYTFLDGDDTSNQERRQQSSLSTVLSREGNDICADCGAKMPTWAVVIGGFSNRLNLGGVFVCIECIGVHRGLWPDRCKEVLLDEWSSKQKEKMAEGGNVKVNEELEYNCSGTLKPNSFSSREIRERFIKDKYAVEDGLLVGRFSHTKHSALPPSAPTVDKANRQSYMRQLAGAPPKYIGVVFLTVLCTKHVPGDSLIIAFNNGFQEVRTQAGKRNGSSIHWGQLVQIGIDNPQRPIYGTIFDGNNICGTVEINFAHFMKNLADTETQHDVTVSVTGKSIQQEASLTLSFQLTRMA